MEVHKLGPKVMPCISDCYNHVGNTARHLSRRMKLNFPLTRCYASCFSSFSISRA